MLTKEEKVLLLKEIDRLVQVSQQEIHTILKFQPLMIQEAPTIVTYQRKLEKKVDKGKQIVICGESDEERSGITKLERFVTFAPNPNPNPKTRPNPGFIYLVF